MNKILKLDFNFWHIFSYIWLIYLFYPIQNYLPVKSNHDLLGLIILALFVVSYILVDKSNRYLKYMIFLELTLIELFVFFSNGYGLQLLIYPGWQISSILGNYSQKYFQKFCKLYYSLLIIDLLILFFVKSLIFKQSFTLVIIIFFILIAPPLAYSLIYNIAKNRHLNQTNRRLEAVIQRGERDRIARDLHDTLGQSFSMITIKAELAEKLLEKRPEQVVEELRDIAHTSRQNLQLVRDIVNDLYQKSLSEVLIEQNKNLIKVNLVLETKGESKALKWPTKIQSEFASVIPEAITNIIRHAHAKKVFMNFIEETTFYQITIHDDGHAKKFEREGSKGIYGMTQRLKEAGGRLIINHQFNGTDVKFILFKDNKND